MSKFIRSIAAPTAFREYKNYVILGDAFIKYFLVTALPEEFDLGILSFYIANPSIKVFLKTKHMNFDISKFIKQEFKEKETQLEKTSDPTLKARLERELMSLNIHIQDIVTSNDKVLDVFIVFSIISDNLEDLNALSYNVKRQLQQEGFKVYDIAGMQQALMKATVPLFINDGLKDDLAYQYRFPLLVASAAGMWPYNFPTLKDPAGFLFGRDMSNHGMIKWDPLYYRHNEKEAIATARTAANCIFFGKTGSGKTTAMNKMIRNFIMNGTKLIWIDPENKNEPMTKRYGGQYVEFGARGSQINVMDLYPVSDDVEEHTDGLWDAELAIYNAIDAIKTIMLLYHKEMIEKLHEALNELGEQVIECYRTKNITFDTDIKTLKPTDFPILSDLFDVVNKNIDLCKNSTIKGLLTIISSCLKPLIHENKFLFDGHSTIDRVNSKMLSFGTKNLKEKNQGVKDALNYLVFRFAWTTCLDGSVEAAFVVDEAHELILEGTAAIELSSIWRRARKYNTVAVMGTQEPRDLASKIMIAGVEMESYGRAIMNNSTYKLFMLLEKEAVESLSGLITLNETERYQISSFVRGQGLFVCGNKRYTIEVLTSDKELREMDPLSSHLSVSYE